MPLSRGAVLTVPETPTVLIAIAASPEERVRLAAQGGSVLLVASLEEALAVLEAMGSAARASCTAPPDDGGPGLDVDSDRRTVRWRERCASLSPLEHDLLTCLLTDLGHTWTFARLHHDVWGNDHQGGRADLHSVVKRLRRKLRELGCPMRIQSVRGVGLRLTDWQPAATPLPLPRPRRATDPSSERTA